MLIPSEWVTLSILFILDEYRLKNFETRNIIRNSKFFVISLEERNRDNDIFQKAWEYIINIEKKTHKCQRKKSKIKSVQIRK